ncbi:MAG: GNAT family N-acetyltransferase [Acidobacteria bacterium]|nr:GNAT family N-acetyltransferase [Acidobacteriota bacterium]
MKTSARLDIVSASNALSWREALDGVRHDFYHEAAYHELCQERGEGEAYLAVYREGKSALLWPYLLRPIEGLAAGGHCDVTSVYGYPGPLAANTSLEFVERGLAALQEHWRSRKAVTAFTRLNSVLGNQALLEAVTPIEESGATVAIDLTLPEEEIWRGYRKTLRHEIKRAREHGLRVTEDEGLLKLRRFVDLYRETMTRNQAAPSYFFGVDYFVALFNALPGRAHLFTVCDGETLVAGGVFVETDGIVQYHLSGSDQRYAGLAPAKLLLDEVRLWAAARGHRHLHLGGGRGGSRDSLFAFKAAFSGRHFPFFVWKCVLQSTIYEELCRLHLGRSSSRGAADAGGAVDAGGYFPAYHRAGIAA